MSQINHSDLENASESGIIGIMVSFLIREVMPWAIHTVGALFTAGIVAVALFFFNRWLGKTFKK
ncbi:MAG TPA: hypothetical protein VFF27_00250 [Bacteroidia bacterium]|jgi:uncharacterized membrane protein YecN with MAPEG domain|nr:hypothetical protein [Bacteroidia bacterium]